MKRKISFMFIILCILVVVSSVFNVSAETVEDEPVIERAKVIEVQRLDIDESEKAWFIESNLVKLEILSGEHKGKAVETIHNLTGSAGFDIVVHPGDRVLVTIEETEDGSTKVYISEYLRDTYVYITMGIFIILLIIIGGLKGVKTIITLILTIILILKVLIPGLLAGYNTILLTVAVSIVITLITIFVVGGINRKSLAAVIGVLGGVFAAGLIAYIIGSKARLTGLSNEEAMMLMYIPQGISFDFRGLLFAGIILGALGAVMDVGMSIASAIDEVKTANPLLSPKELMISGMNVGRDVMGTMANTLILAYTGSAIPLLLLFTAYQDSITRIINLDIIATEVIRALAGSIGLVLCIPLTAATTGMLFKYAKKTKE